jgi:small-conductance mechanosensitive channel
MAVFATYAFVARGFRNVHVSEQSCNVLAMSSQYQSPCSLDRLRDHVFLNTVPFFKGFFVVPFMAFITVMAFIAFMAFIDFVAFVAFVAFIVFMGLATFVAVRTIVRERPSCR